MTRPVALQPLHLVKLIIYFILYVSLNYQTTWHHHTSTRPSRLTPSDYLSFSLSSTTWHIASLISQYRSLVVQIKIFTDTFTIRRFSTSPERILTPLCRDLREETVFQQMQAYYTTFFTYKIRSKNVFDVIRTIQHKRLGLFIWHS